MAAKIISIEILIFRRKKYGISRMTKRKISKICEKYAKWSFYFSKMLAEKCVRSSICPYFSFSTLFSMHIILSKQKIFYLRTMFWVWVKGPTTKGPTGKRGDIFFQ
jgi:hypothetical protein